MKNPYYNEYDHDTMKDISPLDRDKDIFRDEIMTQEKELEEENDDKNNTLIMKKRKKK